jgi:murein DD-endopeptidase MepM/ murein hydrolase activator NlpD
MQKIYLILVGCILISCNSLHSVQSAFSSKTPYEQYILSLEKANLQSTPMATAWVEAGRKALYDSVSINLPFSEAGVFQASEVEARSYSFSVRDGQVLKVNGAVKSAANARVFMDLLVWKDETWTPLAHADSALILTHEFDRDYTCLIRIQPELLVSAYYTITLSATPVLINPVSGASNKSIGSFYGDSRDGGKRAHEGIDIFAPKGTPVVAPTAGTISRVGTSNLGGKVVWMQDGKRGHSYYFAHLDEQLVKAGERVKQGDTLGLVGNTGNARYTPSHLHFGIYQARSKDPIHYVLTMEALSNTQVLDTTFSVQAYRVTDRKTLLRSGPGEKRPLKETLAKNTYIKILAQSKEWYRIALPDKRQGYVLKQTVGLAAKGKSRKLKEPAVLLSESNEQSIPLAYLNKSAAVEILATFDQYGFVRTHDGMVGWVYGMNM